MATPDLRGQAQIESTLMAALASTAPEITDLTEGSVARALINAFSGMAVELQQVALALTRTGILNGVFLNFERTRRPAVPATGSVTISRTSTGSSLTVPQGSVFGVPGSTKTYESIAGAVLAVGISSAQIAVRSQLEGTAGRTGKNTITQVVSNLAQSVTCTNDRAILNGSDEETDAERKAALREQIAGLSKGTKSSLEYAAKQVMLLDDTGKPIETVQTAKVREPFLDDSPPGLLGLVQVYIDNGSGAASAALIELVRKTLRGYTDESGTHKGWVATSIDLEVKPVVGQAVDVIVYLTVDDGYDVLEVRGKVEAAYGALLSGLGVFETLYISDLTAAAKSIPGVLDVRVQEPQANVVPSSISRILPGVVSIL